MIEKIHGTEYMKVKMNFSEYISNIKNFHEFDLGYPELNPFLAKDLSMIDVIKENINGDKNSYLFCLFDGHGGGDVSQFFRHFF